MEKFKIEISTFQCIGGEHFYGRVIIPQKRQKEDWCPINYQELSHQSRDHRWTTIRFDTVQEIVDAATDWFLRDWRVKPGDRLVISPDLWRDRHIRIEKPDRHP